MKSDSKTTKLTRRQMLGTDGQGCGGIGGDDPADPKCDSLLRFGGGDRAEGRRGHRPRHHIAGEDLSARMGRVWRSAAVEPESRSGRTRLLSAPAGPALTAMWSKDSGPGEVKFADAKALITTATFSTPGAYVLRLTADNGQSKDSSTLNVSVETPPPAKQLDAVYTKNFKINSPLWNARAKALMVSWIPHCIDQINRTDLTQGPGGIDNFVEAGKSAARRAARRAQGLRVLQRLGAPDGGGDEHRADDRPAGRSGDHQGAREDARHAGRLDSQDPGRAGARRLSADRVHAAARGRARQRSIPARSRTGNGAAITKATPRATSWNRPSTTT